MAFPSRREHRFTIDGESYCLSGMTRDADRRIRAAFAAAIASAPAVVDALDGPDLYAEAIARECLVEAPELFWETRPAEAGTNGVPTRSVTFKNVQVELWDAFRVEVDTFLSLFRRAPAGITPLAPDAGEAGPSPVAPVETVPTRPRGRAE